MGRGRKEKEAKKDEDDGESHADNEQYVGAEQKKVVKRGGNG